MAVYIIHHQDADGHFAGYAASLYWRGSLDKIHMVPVQYGGRMMYVKNFVLNEMASGDLAYFLDFSYPRETHDELHARGVKQVILDHHKTAEEDLKGLDYAVFDMSKSGALLAWEYFFQDREPPELCMAVNRLDLRKDVTEDDLAISEYLYQNGFLKPDQWDRWKELCGGEAFKDAIEQGKFASAAEILLAYYDKTYEYGFVERQSEKREIVWGDEAVEEFVGRILRFYDNALI